MEGLEYDESVEDDFDEDSERDLILQFVDMVQNTPAGELKVDEIDLLREIMSDFPTDVEDLEPAKGVESLLYRMMDEWEAALRDDDHEKKEAFQPQSSDFSQAISTWEKSENSDKAMHVLSILSDQRELFVNGRTTVQPELSSIKTILRILAASRERGLEKQALQVFESLTEYGLAKDPETYGTMITILAKSRTRGAAKRAEKLLREAVKEFPPQLWEEGQKYGIATGVFNAVITAYAKSEEENGPERAEQLIVFMDQLDSDSGSLGICSPNVNSFTSLIDAYAQQNEWDAVSQADSILNRLLDQYLEGNDGLEPNVATWTIVISAWARLSKKGRKGAASRAGRLLKRMEDLYQEDRISFRPDAIAYNTCMNAYAFSKDRESAPDAEKLLEEMNEMYFDGDDSMKPTSRSIKIVTESWITAGDMEKAEDLLDRYEDALLSDDNPKAALDLKDLYRAMLFGYAQQDDTERATFYLNYMIEKNLHPDNICFDR